MIYVCVCDGEVIGFAGVYSDLIASGMVSGLCSDLGFYCFVGFSWRLEDSIFAESFDLLMFEVSSHFSGRTIWIDRSFKWNGTEEEV